jgi:DNA-binding MarR family transcriptional regulator/ribosomal protein S18 acetylase RimI-like enzyme
MPAQSPPHVADVRGFNRFYTRQIGALNEGLLRSHFSLTEVRVLYELAHRANPTASELATELALDPGYLSRLLSNFTKRGLVRRAPSSADGRQTLLSLTRKGRDTFAGLDARADEEIAGILDRLGPGERARLLEAMGTIRSLFGDHARADEAPFTLRQHRPGDIGWVTHRHGALYAEEYGWDERFEALVARVAADFVDNYDPERERCWIAERNGASVGSVFLVKKTERVAKLRLLLVEPSARGLGIGKRLVDECVRFAREAGYHKITLWTQRNLHAARHLYELAGFQLVKSEPHRSFGHKLVAETWDLSLKRERSVARHKTGQ